MAAARQKEIKVRSAVVATMTRGIPLPRATLGAGVLGVVLMCKGCLNSQVKMLANLAGEVQLGNKPPTRGVQRGNACFALSSCLPALSRSAAVIGRKLRRRSSMARIWEGAIRSARQQLLSMVSETRMSPGELLRLIFLSQPARLARRQT